MFNSNSKCVYNRLFSVQPESSCPILSCPWRRNCEASVKRTEEEKNNVLISAVNPHNKKTVRVN